MTLRCPKCNGHEVFPSKIKSLLDPLLGAFMIQAFRCTRCGRRFRTFATRRELRALHEQILARLALRQLVSRLSL